MRLAVLPTPASVCRSIVVHRRRRDFHERRDEELSDERTEDESTLNSQNNRFAMGSRFSAPPNLADDVLQSKSARHEY